MTLGKDLKNVPDGARSKPELSPEESGGFPGAKYNFPPSKVKVSIQAAFEKDSTIWHPFEILLHPTEEQAPAVYLG